MFGARITIFKLFGFSVRVDMSWLILAVLITWTLAAGVFPFRYAGLPRSWYWAMGVAGAVGLFGSIIFHELSHSLVARRYGLPIKGITLFIFGGVAEMQEEPKSPKAEFLMAAAGPIASLFLAAGFYGLFIVGTEQGWSVPILGVMRYLGLINGLLAAFNLVPGFPLDGGRLLRSMLWGWKGNFRWASRVASRVGEGFGIVLIVLGVFSVIQGNFIGGMWWFLIGMFLRGAAATSYRQVLVRQGLEGEPVRRFMKPNPVTVSPSISVEQLVEDYVYHYHYKIYPVMDDGRLIGCARIQHIKEIPRGQWALHRVEELVQPCSEDNSIRPDADALTALAQMNRSGNSRLMVVDDGKLVGVLTLKDLMNFISLKMELEEGDEQKTVTRVER